MLIGQSNKGRTDYIPVHPEVGRNTDCCTNKCPTSDAVELDEAYQGPADLTAPVWPLTGVVHHSGLFERDKENETAKTTEGKVNVETLLIIIAVLLFLILWRVGNIDSRLKERFPTEKEQDVEWGKKDPAGHWEAHKKETAERKK